MRIESEIDRKAYILQVNTWAEFNSAMICVLYPKDGGRRAEVLRKMLSMKTRLMHGVTPGQGRLEMAAHRDHVKKLLTEKVGL